MYPHCSKWSLSFMFADQNPTCTSVSPIHATCPAHLILLDLIAPLVLVRSTHHEAPLCAVFSSPLPLLRSYPPSIFLSTLFSNTLRLSSSVSVTDQVSHPYQTRKITVQCILIFIFLDMKQEDNILDPTSAGTPSIWPPAACSSGMSASLPRV